MSADLLLEPSNPDFADWFHRLAQRLLAARLVVAGRELRFTEVEAYYHGAGHLDPFTHRDAIQKTSGRWYFHRTGGRLRGGSFKGVDLTFGGPEAFGGMLVRGLADGDQVIDGPSLCVDHLIALTKTPGVAALDRNADALKLRWTENHAPPLLRTARVGLSLRRFTPDGDGPRFLLRRYRYLSDPRRTAKGKLHMALAMHADGRTADDIRALTGVTAAALRRYLVAFDEGAKEADFTAYFGTDLGPKELARLHGLVRRLGYG